MTSADEPTADHPRLGNLSLALAIAMVPSLFVIPSLINLAASAGISETVYGFLYAIPILFSVAAIATGHTAQIRAHRSGRRAGNRALVGVIIGYVELIGTVGFAILVVLMLGPIFQSCATVC